jgi:hypothetical protein
MHTFRSIAQGTIAVLVAASTLWAQVAVVAPGSRELKRAAHRLRVTPERLQNMRLALREATEVARRVDAASAMLIGPVAQSWVQINRPEAKPNLEDLYRALRTAAGNAEDVRGYQSATQAAQSLATAYSEIDFDRAQELIRTWPAPPSRAGEAGEAARREMESQFRQQALNTLAMRDPERAAALLAEGGDESWAARGRIAQHLAATGNKEQASKILDQTLRDLAASTLDMKKAHEYGQLMMHTASIDPAKAAEAFASLARSAAGMNQGAGSRLTVGERSIDLTAGEAVLLNTVQAAGGRFDLASKAVAQAPDLKAKLDRIGGIDTVLSGAERVTFTMGAGMGSRSWGGGGMPPGGPGGPVGPQSYSSNQLYNEVRTAARRDPSAGRQKIAEIAQDPASADALIQFAQRVNWEDPDLAVMALDAARALLPKIEPKTRRATNLQMLVRAYRMVDGEVDPGLLKEGFILASDLREEQQGQAAGFGFGVSGGPFPQGGMGPYGISAGPADHLEAMLVAEYARDNFAGALTYVRSLQDAKLKLLALSQMIQSLRMPF